MHDSHARDGTQDEKIEVLLVDDRPENLLALETVLSSPDYLLIRAESGEQALRYLMQHEPALILMDVQMPEMDGYETASMIKRSERTRSIPIIFITALNEDERYEQKGYAHGAIDYLYKPYDPNILRSKVEVFAELARKTKSLLRAERQLFEAERSDRERQIAQLELKSVKREQAEQKKYLDLVKGISHGIVWAIDSRTYLTQFVSPSAEAILGFSNDEWMEAERFFIHQVSAEDQRDFLEHLETLKQSPHTVRVEHRMRAKSGAELWFQTEMSLALRSDGFGSEVRGMSIDITQVKLAQELLAKSKQRSDFLASASLSLGQSLDVLRHLETIGGKIVKYFADQFLVYHEIESEHDEGEFKQVLSCTREGLIQTSSTDFTYDTTHARILKKWNLREVAESGKPVYSAREMIVPVPIDQKAKYLMFWVWGTPGHQFTSEDFYMAEDLGRRVTLAVENAHLNQKAESAVRVRDEFLSVASHELKTPLTPLKLQAQLLTRMLKNGSGLDLKPEKLDKILNTFDRQLDRLSVLIDELLDISRIANGKLSLNFEEFDLIELVRDVLGRFDNQLTTAKCEIDFQASGELKVCWDRFRIEQVVVNLLTNACKYGEGKPIQIRVTSQEGQASVSFRDQGIGIAKRDLARIFDRFERAVSGRNFSGLGLGLYIVSQLLEAHRGNIHVESELGVGSTFTFSIPKNAAHSAPYLPYAHSQDARNLL